MKCANWNSLYKETKAEEPSNMKTMIAALMIAVIGRVVFEANLKAQTLAPQTTNEKQTLTKIAPTSGPQIFTFRGGVNNAGWLVVKRHNAKALDQKQDFDPCFTSVVSDYKPIVRKMENGKYEIEFTSDLAGKLP